MFFSSRLSVRFLCVIPLLYCAGCFSLSPSTERAKKTEEEAETQKKFSEEGYFEVVATAYTASPEETEGNPRLTACGHTLSDSDAVIAVSRDLEDAGFTCGTRVQIKNFGDKIFSVQDRTSARWKKRIDIFMGSDRQKALNWGRRTVSVRLVKSSIR